MTTEEFISRALEQRDPSEYEQQALALLKKHWPTSDEGGRMKSIDETARELANQLIVTDFPSDIDDGTKSIATAIRAPLLALRQQLTARLAEHSSAINALPEAMRAESFLWRDLGECQPDSRDCGRADREGRNMTDEGGHDTEYDTIEAAPRKAAEPVLTAQRLAELHRRLAAGYVPALEPGELAVLLAAHAVAERAARYTIDTGECLFCEIDDPENGNHEAHCTALEAYLKARVGRG